MREFARRSGPVTISVMCGRYSLIQPDPVLSEFFQVGTVPHLTPRYNIAPSQSVPVVRLHTASDQRECQMLRWGLIPSWSKDLQIGSRLINARSETVAEKPAFRAAFKQRRCLVLADGFYEWQRQGSRKQPFYFRMRESVPFAFAGLWESWQGGNDRPIESCTILTTAANSLLQTVHDRMPVILSPETYDRWLDPEIQALPDLQDLLQPYPAEAMTAYPVSTQVNSPAHDDPTCIQPQPQLQ